MWTITKKLIAKNSAIIGMAITSPKHSPELYMPHMLCTKSNIMYAVTLYIFHRKKSPIAIPANPPHNMPMHAGIIKNIILSVII